VSATHDFRDRAASAFVLALLALGCLVLWIGIPVASMWAVGKLTDDPADHYLIVLVTVLLGMILWGRGLFWLNRLYLRIRMGSRAWAELTDEAEEETRWIRGPLEPLLVGTLVLALIALFAWFFVLAENPSSQVL
jgi:hypothetical protein